MLTLNNVGNNENHEKMNVMSELTHYYNYVN